MILLPVLATLASIVTADERIINIKHFNTRNFKQKRSSMNAGNSYFRSQQLSFQFVNPFTPENPALTFQLELNEKLIHPDFKIINPSSSNNMSENCYYHGKIDNDENSYVSVQTCDNSVIFFNFNLNLIRLMELCIKMV